MPNYQNTQLYELIEHDENGNPVVYRGHTTQPLHKRLRDHRKHFKGWKESKQNYCSSYEVLKHGPGRIELVRVVCCLNVKEANREEGKFIREVECVNIRKNKYANDAERYQLNKETISAKLKEYRNANKETLNAKNKEYRKANKETISAKKKEYQNANKETISAKHKEYYQENKETKLAKAKEYRSANKETISAKLKEYYQANKETLKARDAEKVKCECGAIVSRCSLLVHLKSWKHTRDFIHL
jgi:hypothetical protein